MSKTPGSTEDIHHVLTTTWRVVLTVVALLLAAITLWYLFGRRQVRVAATECLPDTDCTVLISAPVDAVIVSAFLILTALCALMAITGIVFTPTIGGSGVNPLPRNVERASAIPEDATRIVAARTETQNPQFQFQNPHDLITLGQVQPLELWDILPAELRTPVTRYAVETLGMAPADVPMGIREIAVTSGAGTGSGAEQPYYVRLEAAGEDSILKLS